MNRPKSESINNITEHDLIALQFNELTPQRARAVRRALNDNPELAAEAEATTTMFARMKGVKMPSDAGLLDRNWKALRPSLAAHALPLPRMVRWQKPAFAGLVLASAATVGYLAMTMRGRGTPRERYATTHSQANPGFATRQEPGRVDPPTRVPLDSGFKVKLSGGVFHPAGHGPDSAIRMLGLATTGQVLAGAPVSPSVDQARINPAPLTTEPALPPALAPGPLSAEPVQEAQRNARIQAAEMPAPSGAGHGSVKLRIPHTTDVMLAMGGTFIVGHSSLTAGTEPRTQTATHAIAALAAIHQQFRPALGYRITTSYSRPDFFYSYSSGNGSFYDGGDINSRIFELAGTYVVQGPRHRRLSTSADAGGALMAFLPTNPSPSVSYVYRGAGVLGANVDLTITKRWGARLAYRAQIFKSPDFRYTGGVVPVTASLTVSNEPSLGITYRFGKD